MTGLVRLAPREQAALAAPPFHQWAFPDGAPWTEFYRTGSGYLLRFPRLADFEVSGDASAVSCRPAPAVSEETCTHLYLNQVMPLMLSKRGKLVFHASAVEIGAEAVALVGESGRGKSTLAASFARAGHRFLTDDGLVIEAVGGGFRALPSHPSIRLWKDSEEALMAEGARRAGAVQYTDKSRFLAGGGLEFCSEARPLRSAYFLGGDAAAPRIQPMSESEALVEWVKNSFLLDPTEQRLLAAHFEQLAPLANGLACYRFDYPRRFDALAEVRAALVGHRREADGRP